MGRLIKNHWARLIILSAGACELDHHQNCQHGSEKPVH